MMPNLSGPELCRKIRSAALDHYVYVLLCTAKDERSDLIEGMEAGADDFLVKPISRDELRVRIRAGERILKLERGLAERNRQLGTAYGQLQSAYELIERDLKAAAWMQENLLPPKALSAEGISCRWHFRPSSFVGGDIFNFFSLGAGQVGLYMLDVSGHGVPAAMLSVTLSMVLTPDPTRDSPLKQFNPETGNFDAVEPAAAVLELNRRFQSKEDRYFTMIYGIVDTRMCTLRLAQAGHPNPVVMSLSGELTVLGTGGMPVGLWPEIDFDVVEVPFHPGDRLVLYSDGVSECMNRGDEGFGDARLLRYLKGCTGKSLDDILTGLGAENG
jgi:sigma-B regulation protein RsbU (phosphoserine phosphatase)